MIDAKFGNLIPCIWIETHLRKKEKKRIINSIFDWKIMYKYTFKTSVGTNKKKKNPKFIKY